MTALIWFNEDGLNYDHQMVKDYEDSRCVYVFDVGYLENWKIGKHRVQFIYESLLEIKNIEIYKGETVGILRELLEGDKVTEVVTTETPNHIIKEWQNEVSKYVNLVVYPEVYPVKDNTSPRRFARYWKKHNRAWLMP